MISYKNKEVFNSSELAVTIIDFGFVDKFKDEKKAYAHIERSETVDLFQGNLLFASIDHMKFFRTSRKDDIIAMFYMMIHLMCDNSFCANQQALLKLKKALKLNPDINS